MTNIAVAPHKTTTTTKDVVLAYIDAIALAEPIQARLWQKEEVTVTQVLLLKELLRKGPMTIGRLGQALGFAPASISRLVDRLEKRDLVSRRRELPDRREVLIRLEPAGERLLGEVRLVRGTDMYAAVESMSEEERLTVASALRLLVDRTRAVTQE